MSLSSLIFSPRSFDFLSSASMCVLRSFSRMSSCSSVFVGREIMLLRCSRLVPISTFPFCWMVLSSAIRSSCRALRSLIRLRSCPVRSAFVVSVSS